PPVTDWATDFDHADPGYAERAPEIWDQLRESCPVAHSPRYGGTWLPVRHDDVAAIAKDPQHFTSQGVIVSDFRPDIPRPVGYAPPITSDPPFHKTAREFLLTAFSPKAIARWEQPARATCHELLDSLLAGGTDVVDAARQYAQHIPVRVIAEMLGVPREDGDVFRDFIHRIIETPGGDEELDHEDTLDFYLDRLIEARRKDPRDDLITHMVSSTIGGEPLTPEHVRGTCGLLLIAGIDTTWSAIGASLWHLAGHPDDRRRWLEDPAVRPFAIEELLRFYAPVTMARLVAEDVELGGRSMGAGDWVLLPFPAANRDPHAFERAGEFVIDRQRNRHSAFGLGIHRCVGSNLARLELSVAIEEWMRRIPDFELLDPDGVVWSAGQIRGPRQLPVRIRRTREER
ncbi:MAG: cytochrome P450, partial [Acidimicrobiales bacterium]